MTTDFEIAFSTYENELRLHELLLDDTYHKRSKLITKIEQLKNKRTILSNYKILMKTAITSFITHLISYQIIISLSIYVILTVIGINIIPLMIFLSTILNIIYNTNELKKTTKELKEVSKNYNLLNIEQDIKNYQEQVKITNQESRDIKKNIYEIKQMLSFLQKKEINERLNNMYNNFNEEKPLIKKLLK